MALSLALVVCLSLLAPMISADRTITVHNRCSQPIWIGQLTNNNGAPLAGGIRHINSHGNAVFNIPDWGWAGRMWPKIGCNDDGQACAFGQSIPPCGQHGCTPPADTKIEFYFPSIWNTKRIWYDISLVDGYSLPTEIIPSQTVRSIFLDKFHISSAQICRSVVGHADRFMCSNDMPSIVERLPTE